MVLFGLGYLLKHPIRDLTIGNEAKCCIGVYLSDSDEQLSNGIYMPFYLADMATQFQQIQIGGDRFGLGLLFAGETDEKIPQVIVNSIELNDDKYSISHEMAHLITVASLEWISHYGRAAGFRGVAISNHSYNTGYNHAKGNTTRPSFSSLRKFHSQGEFYSDLFNNSEEPEVDASSVEMFFSKQSSLLKEVDPERYFMSSTLKTYDDNSLAKRISGPERVNFLREHLMAYHLLEDKPVDPEVMIAFSHTLSHTCRTRADQLALCLKLIALPWDEVRILIERMDKR